MARGVNKVILIGNMGADPEIKYFPDGGAMAVIRLATSESWKDKSTGEQVVKTEWHRVVVYSKLAELAAEHTRKGSKIYVEGQIRTNKWKDKDQIDRYSTEIVGNTIQFLDSKEKDTNQYEYQSPKAQPTATTSATQSLEEVDELPF